MLIHILYQPNIILHYDGNIPQEQFNYARLWDVTIFNKTNSLLFKSAPAILRTRYPDSIIIMGQCTISYMIICITFLHGGKKE